MEKISVAIRVRPLSKQEGVKASPWSLGPNTISFTYSSSIAPQAFTFDRVYASDSPTLAIYDESAKHIIASTVRGFNGTIFAYGQTSSGKTYTMRGSAEEPGIIPLAVEDVFFNTDQETDREFLIRVSYMEIYNEEINDLLAPDSQKLQVHENIERGIFVAGLREEIVSTPEQVLELLAFGEAHRRVGETNMNVYSSRSHTIFRMVIESRNMEDDGSSDACDAVRVSVLNLVDLAGSERVSKTGAEGARLKEGTHINKSLMTLGNVINKLSDGIQRQGGHVPYRDSKLTRILQPALGGNAKTAIICTITPALIHADETKGTLNFASRANRVTNCAQVNEVMTDAALLKRQKREIEELRTKLQESHSEHLEDEILSLRNKLLKFELEKERLSLELLEEKKVQAECERRIKEQKEKIEKLGTMVINSAIDDRDYAKKGSRRERRETWCPRVPPSDLARQIEGFKRNPKKEFSTQEASVLAFATSDRSQPMPPPFEMLLEDEEECMVWGSQKSSEEDADMQKSPSASLNGNCSFLKPSAHIVQRKRRSLPTTMGETELQQEITELRSRYHDLQSEHDLKMSQMMLEMEELKRDLATAQLTCNREKLNNQELYGQLQDRRCKSLDGVDTANAGASIKQLRAQVDKLETEKFYMQRELDRLMEQAKGQTTTAQEDLKELYQELKETTEQLNSVVEQNKLLQEELSKRKLLIKTEESTHCSPKLEHWLAQAEPDQKLACTPLKGVSSESCCLPDEACQATTVIPSSLQNNQGMRAVIIHDDGSLQDVAGDPPNVTGLLEDLALLATEKAELVAKLANAKQIAKDLRLANDKLRGEASIKHQMLEYETRHSVVGLEESKEDVCRECEVRRSAVDTKNALSWEEEHLTKATGSVMELSEPVLEETEPVKAVAEEVIRGAPEISIHGGNYIYEVSKLFWSLLTGQASTALLASIRGTVESALDRNVSSPHEKCGRFLSAVQSDGTELTMNILIDKIMVEVEGTLPQVLSDLMEENGFLLTEFQALADSIGMHTNVQSHDCLFNKLPNELAESSEDEKPIDASSSASNFELQNTVGRYRVLEFLAVHICMQLEKCKEELKLPNTSLLTVDVGSLRALPQEGCLANRKDHQEDEARRGLTDKASYVQGNREKPMAEWSSIASKSQDGEGVDELSAPEFSTTPLILEKVLSFTEGPSISTMSPVKPYEDSMVATEGVEGTRSGQCPVLNCEDDVVVLTANKSIQTKGTGMSISNHKTSSVQVAVDVHQGNVVTIGRDIGMEYASHMEALQSAKECSDSQLEMVKQQLEAAHADLFTSKNRITEMEKVLADKDEQCMFYHRELEGMREQKASSENELSQFRSDILALRKDLSAAKAAPSLIEKERDALRKETEKLKLKTKETESKVKSILQDKSKLEAEKANIERELKHLRGSTILQRDINRRESIADKRRESMAPVSTKTKQQLCSLENMLQIKTTELERAAFDIQVLQESCSKLEFSVVEAENLGNSLREQLAHAEASIANLKEENASKDMNAGRLMIELEASSEQWRASMLQKEALEQQNAELVAKLQEHEVTGDSKAAELAKEKEELAQQLTDAFIEFEEEKAAWASNYKDHCERISADVNARFSNLEMRMSVFATNLEQVVTVHEDVLAVLAKIEEEMLSFQVAIQDDSFPTLAQLERLSTELNSMRDVYMDVQEQHAKVAAKPNPEKNASAAQTAKVEEMVSILQQRTEVMSSLEAKCKELSEVCSTLESRCKELTEICSTLDLRCKESTEENRQLFTLNMKLQVVVQATREREEVFQGRLQQALCAKEELERCRELRQQFTGTWKGKEETAARILVQQQYGELRQELAASRLEIVELKVELENARIQCQKLQSELDQCSPELRSEQEARMLEIEHENCILQRRLKVAEERAKTRRDMIKKLREDAKGREEASDQASFKELMFQRVQLEEQVGELKSELSRLHKQLSRHAGNGTQPHLSFINNTTDNVDQHSTSVRVGKLLPATRTGGADIAVCRGKSSPFSGRVALKVLDQNKTEK